MSVPALRFKDESGHYFSAWTTKPLGKLAHFIKDGTHGTHQEAPNSNYYLLSAKNINNGVVSFDSSDRKISKSEFDGIYKSYKLEAGDVLLTVVGTIGRVAVYSNVLCNVAFQRSVAFFRFTAESSSFMAQLFTTTSFQNKLLKNQVVSAQPGIYLGDLSKITVTIPSKQEQTKIANFLTAVDEKITQLTQKHDLLTQYKKGVMQQIFSQELRFKDDDGQDFPEWAEQSLGDFLIPDFREVSKPKGDYLSIGVRSHCKGTFQKPDADPEKNSMDKLFVVHQGDLIVNITFAWEGAIAIVKEEDHGGYVSHRFPTYTFKPEVTFAIFFQYVFVHPKFRETLDLISPGGAGRNRVLSKKEFLKITVNLPSLKEQTKIANFLTAIDDKITAAQNQLLALKQYKQGLLQQMFV